MDAIGNVLERKERPAYVRFKRAAVENKSASLAAGKFVGVDVDFAYITPPYSKDEIIRKVPEWFAKLEQDVQMGRISPEWVKQYRDQYRAFQQGQEAPLNGTAIRGWGVINPSQQELLISLRIMTVEDAAMMNDEAIHRIGMGAVEIRDKAKAWLAQVNDKGPLTQQMAAVSAENRTLKDQVEALTHQVGELMKLLPKEPPSKHQDSIVAADLIETPHEELVAAYIEKFGKPPHHRKSDATIRSELEG